MIKHTIYPDRGYALIVIEGHPSLEEYVEGARLLGADPDFYPELHRLCDFTGADTFDASTQELLAFSKEVLQLPATRESKTALVAETPHKAGFLKLFASKFDRSRMQVFKNRPEAISFISSSNRPEPEFGGLRIHRLEGKITVDMVAETNSRWLNREDFEPMEPVLWDLRDAEFTDSLPAMETFGKAMFDLNNDVRPTGKSAVLVTSTYQEVVLQHCFQLSIEAGRTRIFKDEGEARAWLLDSD